MLSLRQSRRGEASAGIVVTDTQPRKTIPRVRGLIAVAALVLVSGLAVGCGGQPEDLPAPGSWLVLLCKASDAPTEPHPKSFYETLFSKSESDLLFDYFQAVSAGAVDVSGSRVYGWFSMPVDTATLQTRNNGAPVTRAQTAQDCKSSAIAAIATTGTQVDPTKYAGVIEVINVPVDSGQAGADSVVANNVEVAGPGFLEHEMLHVLGLDHSWRAAADTSSDHVWAGGNDAEYRDCWDMMSWLTCVFQFSTSMGSQGPELQGEYRQRLGWLQSDRIEVVSTGPGTGTQTVNLAPLSDPDKPGALLARIALPTRGHYAIEYREKARFDRGIPGSAVVIREVRNNGLTYLVQRQGGSIGWHEGETFTDKGDFLSITVDDITPGQATIRINTAFTSGTAAVGDLCGDKYRGEIANCPAGTDCRARRTGQLVSIDWFCLAI